MNDDFIAVCKIKRYIGSMNKIISKPFLNDMLLIPRADDKLVDSIRGIDLHDMPEDRHFTDLYHRFRLKGGFFGNAGSKTTRENYRFHITSPI